MAYQHGRTLQTAPVVNVEQARRRNAEARIELARLEAEHKQLAPRIETMRLQVTAARRKLTRQIRELDAARAQAERLANTTVQVSTLPEPIYGGREGLEAATAEIEAHEAKGTKFGTVRKRTEPKHGTPRKYRIGCRCEDCKTAQSEYKATRRAA